MIMNTGLQIPSVPLYRSRKGHKKSRNGCLRCKQRKKKCDETTPRCSQCAKRGLCCQYRQRDSDSGSRTRSRYVSPSQLDDSSQSLQQLDISGHTYAASSDGSLMPTPSPSSSSRIHSSPRILTPGPEELSVNAHPEILDGTDVELFNHYLTHTSLIIPFDKEDLYALRIGIPKLALRSKPLIASILALAAVCKAHDLVKHDPRQHRDEILDLLSLADRHHRASLLQVQLDIPNACKYDYVLANATLMVLYASASHCVRIRLMETQTEEDPLPREYLPTQSQWISLIRAAYLAFVGLSNDHSGAVEGRLDDTDLSETTNLPFSNWRVKSVNEIISPENGPTERTKNLLLPILAASSGPALTALRARAHSYWKSEGHAESWTYPDERASATLAHPSSNAASLQACFAALDVLEDIMKEVFSTTSSSPPPTSNSDLFDRELESLSRGRLSTVSTWLRGYVARVTSSATTPRPLRRVIMAFLNRVPAEYLILLQTTLDSIGVQSGTGQRDSWGSSYAEFSNLSAAHQLAIDIFAHWAVLVTLLDGVWWIGGIGAWELRRVVLFVRARGWLDDRACLGGHWWPESMDNIGRELKVLLI